MKKSILGYIKYFGIYFSVILIFYYKFLYDIGKIDYPPNFTSLSDFLIRYPLCDLLYCIAFIPTIVILYYLFKKVKSKSKRIILVSLLMPLTALLFNLFLSDKGVLDLILIFISFFAFWGTLFASKKDVPLKKEFLIIEILIFFITFIFMFTNAMISNIKDYSYIKKELQNFDIVIKFLDDYKGKKGIYPEKIDYVKSTSNEYIKYKYETNGKDYILKVYRYDDEPYKIVIYGCLNKKYSGCEPKQYSSKQKKWIRMEKLNKNSIY